MGYRRWKWWRRAHSAYEFVVNWIAILKVIAVLKAIHTLSIKTSASIEVVFGKWAENIKNPAIHGIVFTLGMSNVPLKRKKNIVFMVSLKVRPLFYGCIVVLMVNFY